VGTVIGSNVFNNLWIVGVVAMVEPIRATASEVLLAVVAGVTTLLLLIPRRDDVVPRWRGALLLGLTAAYVAGTVALGP
jgi:cation:H+ antiporter